LGGVINFENDGLPCHDKSPGLGKETCLFDHVCRIDTREVSQTHPLYSTARLVHSRKTITKN
jgi:hypothetical protein